MKRTTKESDEIKSQGLYIADKCDSCGKLLNQTIRYTRPDRKGYTYCSAECCDLASNGEDPPEATSPHSITGSVVHELIAEKVYGSCASCGLPLRDGTKAMHIPDLPGLYDCVACAEQGIYERGCRFCGEPLSSTSQRFCPDRCANAARECQFGDGHRLLVWLRAHSPEMVGGRRRSEEEATQERKCASCGSRLNGKRRQAKYCSKACQKREERFRTSTGTEKPRISPETATAPLCLQGVTGTENTQIVLARG
jgi:hypothetical protein